MVGEELIIDVWEVNWEDCGDSEVLIVGEINSKVEDGKRIVVFVCPGEADLTEVLFKLLRTCSEVRLERSFVDDVDPGISVVFSDVLELVPGNSSINVNTSTFQNQIIP